MSYGERPYWDWGNYEVLLVSFLIQLLNIYNKNFYCLLTSFPDILKTEVIGCNFISINNFRVKLLDCHILSQKWNKVVFIFL